MNRMNAGYGMLVAACALLCAAPSSAGGPRPTSLDFDGAAGVDGAQPLMNWVREQGAPAPTVKGERVYDSLWGRGDHQSPWDGGWSHRWDWERVKRLAHEVEEKAAHVHREVEQRAHHGDWREQQALRDLHQLETRAAHFHTQVERWSQNASHTRSDYSALLDAYNRSARSIHGSHAEPHVRADFSALRRSLGELDYYYRDGGYDGGHGDHDDHGGWPQPGWPRYPSGGHGRYPQPW